LDSISVEFLDSILEYVSKRPPDMKSKACSAKPRTKTVETQTDVSELNDMERIQLVPEDIVHYIPVPIPTLIHVPFPGYFLHSPVPIPFPLPIPVPIPIPVIIPTVAEEKKNSSDDGDDNDDTEPDLDKGPAVPANSQSTVQPTTGSDGENSKDNNKSTSSETTSRTETNNDDPPTQNSHTNSSLKFLSELTSEIGGSNSNSNMSPTKLNLSTVLQQQQGYGLPSTTTTTHQKALPLPLSLPPPACPPMIPVVNSSPSYNSPPVLDFPSPVISPQVVPSSYSYNSPQIGSGNYSASTNANIMSSPSNHK